MSIDRKQFEKWIVQRTLDSMELPSKPQAQAQLMAMAAWESSGGRYLAQVRGPARGPWQMEPPTLKAVCDRVGYVLPVRDGANRMTWDLRFACEMARRLLWYDPKPLPEVEDRHGHYLTYRRVWRPGKPPTEARFHKALDDWR